MVEHDNLRILLAVLVIAALVITAVVVLCPGWLAKERDREPPG